MTAPALIRRFVVAFFVVSGVVFWMHFASLMPDDDPPGADWAYFVVIVVAALIGIGPDSIRAAGRR